MDRDFGIDQYVSWSLPKYELNLNTIWDRFEEFCKSQSNEVRVCFDLLTNFRQGNHSVDKWYNAVHTQVNLAKYPLETAKILHCDIIWFFMKDEDFVSKTINEGSVDLEKFLASTVCQIPKKMESSKATARHIMQVVGDTEHPPGKHKKRKPVVKQGQPHPKNTEKQPSSQFKRNCDPKIAHKNTDRCTRCVDSTH